MNRIDYRGDSLGRTPPRRALAAPVAGVRPSEITQEQGKEKVDALQRLLWGALIVSFPFTALSFGPEKLKTFGQPAVLLTGLLAILTVGAAALPQRRFFLPRGRSVVLLAIFLTIVTLSFFVNYPVNPYMWPGHNPWTKSAKQLVQWLTDGMVVYLTLRFIQTWSDFRYALRCCFIGFLCAVGAAFLEMTARHWPGGRIDLFFQFLHNGGMEPASGRLSLLAYEPSMAGDYLLCVLPLLICGAFYWKSRCWTIVWSLAGIILFCATFSLGCFGALFAACAVVATVYARRGSKGLLIGSLLLATVLVVAVFSSSKGEEFLGSRISEALESGLDPANISDYSTRQRLANAEAAFDIFLDHPWTGVGVGKSPFYMYGTYPVWGLNQGDVYAGTFGSESPEGAGSFNLFIQVLAEMGIVGGIVFVALLLSMLADCYGALNAVNEKWKRRVFAGILFALVAQIIHYNAMEWLGMRYWFFIWGLAICAVQLAKQKDPKMQGRKLIARRLTVDPRQEAPHAHVLS